MENICERVEGALADKFVQAATIQLNARISREVAGFVVELEPGSVQYARVTYRDVQARKNAEDCLRAYKAILEAEGMRVHMNDGRLVVGERVERESVQVKEWAVIDYTEDDVREQRLELMLETAEMFKNGCKRAFANHLVESWAGNTLPKIGRDFCLTDEASELVYDKLYAVACMTPAQVARVHKYSRADWSQTATGVMRSLVRQDRVLDAASAIDVATETKQTNALADALHAEGTRYSDAYTNDVLHCYERQRAIDATHERALEATQAVYASQGMTVLEAYDINVSEDARAHYHLTWWKADTSASDRCVLSVAFCKHAIVSAYANNKRMESRGLITDVAPRLCIGAGCTYANACEECNEARQQRENDIDAEYATTEVGESKPTHYHVAWDARVMREGRFVWERLQTYACCKHQLPYAHDSKQDDRGENVSDVAIVECVKDGCRTIDACGVCEKE
jgi:hypothetical protein